VNRKSVAKIRAEWGKARTPSIVSLAKTMVLSHNIFFVAGCRGITIENGEDSMAGEKIRWVQYDKLEFWISDRWYCELARHEYLYSHEIN